MSTRHNRTDTPKMVPYEYPIRIECRYAPDMAPYISDASNKYPNIFFDMSGIRWDTGRIRLGYIGGQNTNLELVIFLKETRTDYISNTISIIVRTKSSNPLDHKRQSMKMDLQT